MFYLLKILGGGPPGPHGHDAWIWIWIVSRQGSVLEHHTDDASHRHWESWNRAADGLRPALARPVSQTTGRHKRPVVF